MDCATISTFRNNHQMKENPSKVNSPTCHKVTEMLFKTEKGGGLIGNITYTLDTDDIEEHIEDHTDNDDDDDDDDDEIDGPEENDALGRDQNCTLANVFDEKCTVANTENLYQARVAMDSSITKPKQSTSIYIPKAKHQGGAKLVTTEGLHYIEMIDTQQKMVFHHLKLRTGDKILAVNGACVENWEHEFVCQCLNQIISETGEAMTFVIERIQGGKTTVLTISVSVQIRSRGLRSKVDIAVSVAKHAISPPISVTCVRFEGKARCWIKFVAQQQFLLNSGDALDIQPIITFEDKRFQFDRYSFVGTEDDHNSPTTVFICVFRCVTSGRYLYCARGQPQIGLSSMTLQHSIQEVRRPDPRFFLVHQFDSAGAYAFESMVYRDWYLCWNPHKRCLTIEEHPNMLPGSFLNGEFDMVTGKQLARTDSVK